MFHLLLIEANRISNDGICELRISLAWQLWRGYLLKFITTQFPLGFWWIVTSWLNLSWWNSFNSTLLRFERILWDSLGFLGEWLPFFLTLFDGFLRDLFEFFPIFPIFQFNSIWFEWIVASWLNLSWWNSFDSIDFFLLCRYDYGRILWDSLGFLGNWISCHFKAIFKGFLRDF